jgi:hypothetical protein
MITVRKYIVRGGGHFVLSIEYIAKMCVLCITDI